MKWILALQFLLPFYAHSAFTIPSGLETRDAQLIVDRFAVGLMTKNPMGSVREDKLDAFLSVSSSYLETDEISKLGSGTSRSPLQVQKFHFGLQIPFGVELGLETSIISNNNRIQQFGGYSRWVFARWRDLQLHTLVHGSSSNIRSLLGINLYGAQVGASYNLGQMTFYASTGELRATSTFQPQLFNSGGNENYRFGRRYSHQVFRVSYEIDRWMISAQSDWVKKFHNSILITYRL